MIHGSFRRLRAAVILMVGVLCAVIVTGSATTRTTYIITDGDIITTVEGYAGEVDSALRRAGIRVSPGDQVLTDRAGDVVEVRIGRTAIAYEQNVLETTPHQTIHQEDPDAPVGETRVLQRGQDGQVVETVEVVTGPDGAVTRTSLGTETTEAVDEIVSFGTKLPSIPESWLD